MASVSSSSSPTASRPIRFEGLAGIRFLAAMGVVLYHFFDLSDALPGSTSPPEEPRWAVDILSRYLPGLRLGFLAVDFFFILSVLAHVYFRQIEQGIYSHAQFLKKRFARIYPLHLAMTLLLAIVVVIGQSYDVRINHAENFSFAGFLLNAFLANGLNIIPNLTWNGPSWCVSSEWQAYLAFPIVALLVLKAPGKGYVALAFALALFGIAYYYVPSPPLLTQRTYDWGTLRLAVEFPIGLALYRVYRDYVRAKCEFIDARHVWGALFLTFCAFQLRADEWLIVLLLATSLFVLAAAETYRPTPVLSHPWMVYGGEISYAIYLVHIPFLVCVRKVYLRLGAAPGSFAECCADLAAVAFVVPVAALAYRVIEAPAYRRTLQLLDKGAGVSSAGGVSAGSQHVNASLQHEAVQTHSASKPE